MKKLSNQGLLERGVPHKAGVSPRFDLLVNAYHSCMFWGKNVREKAVMKFLDYGMGTEVTA